MSSHASSSLPDRRQRTPARHQRHYLTPFLAASIIGVGAIALVAYLLWPTWNSEQAGDPQNLPMLIGNTPFNVPTKAVRVKLQKRTGPQERVDLNFAYPSLEPPQTQPRVSADTVEETAPGIDRIFLSIIAHHGALSPDERIRSIYPRYLNPNPARVDDGLSLRPFRDGTPYMNEDLIYASAPAIVARCTRDTSTPGMCLSERRVDGADMTFRFPRSWLAQWRDVASAMERLTAQLRQARK